MDSSYSSSSRYAELVKAWLARLPQGSEPSARLLVVDVDARPQKMGLLEGGVVKAEYLVSAARSGLGQKTGSNKTPAGWHRLHAFIGKGREIGTCFVRQTPQAKVWREWGATSPAMILTRILVLQGLEAGVNLGGAVDTLTRGIYIHGTNCQAALGTPASHGCIRMNFREVADLYALLQKGDQVLIAGGTPV